MSSRAFAIPEKWGFRGSGKSVPLTDSTPLTPPVLSVVLPTLNEQDNIGRVLDRALEVLPEVVERFEVLVVDDGSTDSTVEVVSGYLGQHHPRVRLLRHAGNQGYGAALRSGLDAARGSLLFYTDADCQFDLAELKYLLPLMGEADMVLGFRVYRYDSVLRSMVSWMYNRIVNVMFRVRVRDVDCAFKLFTAEVWEQAPVEAEDFFFDTELVARARKWNFRIVQKGVRQYPRTAGETTVGPSDVPQTLRTIARMWRRIYFPKPTDRAGAEAGSRAQVEEIEPAMETA
jgi:dolichol-phosphate mannosyltransferase